MLRSSNSALAALRASTAAAHRALESTLEIADPSAGEAAYARYLEALLGWIDPLERSLWSGVWPDPVAARARSVKTSWIESDLRARGLNDQSISELPRHHALPPMHTLADRFGVGYVVEGSLLGGQMLLRRLGPRVAPLPTRWLEGYGAETGGRWGSFVAELAVSLHDRADIERAARSANVTFELAHGWFSSRGVA